MRASEETAPDEIHLRPIEATDLPALAGWLAEPGVHRWWCEDLTTQQIEARYCPGDAAGATTEVWVVELDGVASGMIQRYRFDDEPEWRATVLAAMPSLAGRVMAGTDYLLGRPDARGRGVGTRLLDLSSRRIFADMPDVDTIVVGVHQDNRPSWRALERAGYRRVWAGELDSDDPSDAGPHYLLTLTR